MWEWRRSRNLVLGCARMRARPVGPAESSALHDFARCGPTTEAHRRALNRSGGLLRSVAGQARLRRDPTQRNDRRLPLRSQQCQKLPLPCGFGARGRIRTCDLPITRRMLAVGLDGSRRIWPAHVGGLFGPDGSRRIQKDRLDDQTDDQGLSDRIGCQGKQVSPRAHGRSRRIRQKIGCPRR